MSRLDHDANVRPWVQAAQRRRRDRTVGRVRRRHRCAADRAVPRPGQRADPGGRGDRRPATRSAPARTWPRSPRSPTRPAHWSMWTVCTRTPHAPIDVAALGADFYVTSAYKWSGPHIAACVADPARWERAAAGQAGAVARRRAGAVRARHAELRTAGRGHRRGRPPGRPGGRRTGDRRDRCSPRWPRSRRTSRGFSPRYWTGLARHRRGDGLPGAGRPVPDGGVPGGRPAPGADRRTPGGRGDLRVRRRLLRRRVLPDGRACAKLAARCGRASTTTRRPDEVDRLLDAVKRSR